MMRWLLSPVPAALSALVLLLALYVLANVALEGQAIGRWHTILLAASGIGAAALLVAVTAGLWQLWQARRAGVIGSRLTLRWLGMFVILLALPVGLVYYFAARFLTAGVDSWFDTRVEQAVQNSLLLGSTALEAVKQDTVDRVTENAGRLSDDFQSGDLVRPLDEWRERSGYAEVTMFASDGRILAHSSQEQASLLPKAPDEAALAQVRKGQGHAAIVPVSSTTQELRVMVPLAAQPGGREGYVQVVQALPARYAKLASSVENATAQYRRMVFAREPLKYSLLFTLTLVTLVAMLIAVWAAIQLSRRLARPIMDLAAGTRAVAAGDYRQTLPVASRDELGVLVENFNEMTRRIHLAQTELRRSQRYAEEQKAYLETLLAHLSSGVLSLDARGRLRTANAEAGKILGLDLASAQGSDLRTLYTQHPRLEPCFSALERAVAGGGAEWQAEMSVFGPRGRQVMFFRLSRLPGRQEGYVVVMDDLTALIQAQRDAAWGEVARRLAHEIRNPLTPIQLSAERIRRRYLDKVPESERAALDRATRTIAEQVDAMKDMVNAFSEYAQPRPMQVQPLQLNQLIQDVVELHRREDRPVGVRLELEPRLPPVRADLARLRQVLNNLLSNAREALAGVARPEITVHTRAVAEADTEVVEMSVADNGPGIPEGVLERIFEPYVTTKEKGTGLGLAIVKRIVEEHAGELWAENAPGGGARVTIRLPLSAESRREKIA
jgi:nitrogen fixation/metabolism regulation signal transduction histidine kinase